MADTLQCGTWRLGREIGSGAYGVVYLAVGPDGERAAVKVCRRDAVGGERYERELRGAKLYRAIPPQEGLVRMRDLVEADWGFYTVMDLADDEFGGSQEPESGYRPKTLARVIEGEKALPLKECARLGVALANGLAALQRHHLLHRDIKPANVLYVGGRPVLSDPGLVVEEAAAVSTVGTPGYVPPERKFTDAASDIYSLGLTLKAASFGRSVEDLDKGPSMEADTGAALFPAWWRILNKATDPTPSRRHQSAKALLKDLQSLRRKMRMSAVWGSRIAKVAIAVGVMAIVGIAVVSVMAGKRVRRELSEQSDRFKELEQFRTKQQEAYAQKLLKHLDEEAQGSLYPESVLDALGIPYEITISDFEVFPAVTVAERKRRDLFWKACAAGERPYRAKKHVAEAKVKVSKVIQANRDVARIRTVNAARADELQSSYDEVVKLDAEIDALQKEFDILHQRAKEKVGKGHDDIEEFVRASVIAHKLNALATRTDYATGRLRNTWDSCKKELLGESSK